MSRKYNTKYQNNTFRNRKQCTFTLITFAVYWIRAKLSNSKTIPSFIYVVELLASMPLSNFVCLSVCMAYLKRSSKKKMVKLKRFQVELRLFLRRCAKVSDNVCWPISFWIKKETEEEIETDTYARTLYRVRHSMKCVNRTVDSIFVNLVLLSLQQFHHNHDRIEYSLSIWLGLFVLVLIKCGLLTSVLDGGFMFASQITYN